MKRVKIAKLLKQTECPGKSCIKGWLRTKRDSKNLSFLEVNDGSCLSNIQVIANDTLINYDDIQKLTTGAALDVRGDIVASPGKGQKWEIVAEKIQVIDWADETYPLQKKRHSDAFLRSIAHLRPRTNKYGAMFRLRSSLCYAIHKFYKDLGFIYIHTPIITGSDCEGAGELFSLTTLDLNQVPISDGQVDYAQDFFGQAANLTVSGQLSAEMFALALGDVYTFGPTFRAENSNTSRHAAEFWMLEPEMAFCDLEGNMTHAESLIKYLIEYIQKECAEDLTLFARFVDKELMKTLANILEEPFEHVPYAKAVEIITQSHHKFEYALIYGNDLQTEHERFLTELYFKKPVIVHDYPKAIKPFYMRVNEDGSTVAAMDVLVPRIGELIGGSQREERLDTLRKRMKAQNMVSSDYWWYLESRKYGSVPHSGFGMGFERLLMLITGVTNIRDVIPFPRTPNSIDF